MYQLKFDKEQKKWMRKRFYSSEYEFENLRDIDQLVEQVNALLDKQPDFLSDLVAEKRREFYANLLDEHILELFEQQKLTPAEMKKRRADKAKADKLEAERLKMEKSKAKKSVKVKAKPGMAEGSQNSFEARRSRYLGEKVTIT